MGRNLNQKVTKTATRWKERAKQDRINRRNISRAQRFALELMEYMESQNMKQTDLAKKMGVSPQQINKILRGKGNLTFETLDKIEDALNVKISTPRIEPKSTKRLAMIYDEMQIVHRRKPKVIEENVSSERVVKVNPLLETNMENMDSYSYTANQI